MIGRHGTYLPSTRGLHDIFNRFRLYNWNSKRGAWDEGKMKEIKYLYTVTALAWKYDGSKIIAVRPGELELIEDR